MDLYLLYIYYSHNKCSDPEDEWDTTTTTTTAVGQQDNPTTSNDITDNINTTEITSNASLGMCFSAIWPIKKYIK